MKGYTPMLAGSSHLYDGNASDPDVPQGGSDAEDEARPKRQKSVVAEKKADFERLVHEAEKNSPEYASIVQNASVAEDITNDCWGALVFVIVNDFPDLRAGRALIEGKVRVLFCFFLWIVNLFIQGVLLWYIGKLLMLPDMLGAQDLYKHFHKAAFTNHRVNIELFDQMSGSRKDHLCGMAMSQGLFVRVILFLWVTTNIGELRDNFNKMRGIVELPRLPDGMNTRLMVRDLPDTAQSEFCILCLNMKGKVGLYVLVFIPKMIIAILLLFMGSLWLIAAESIGDLILNSLALAFVVKVDELIATAFFPSRLQQDCVNLCMMLPSDPDEKDEDKRMHKVVKEFFECTSVVFGTMALVETMFRFQFVIPNYQFDVASTCAIYLSSQMPWCAPWQKECFPTG